MNRFYCNTDLSLEFVSALSDCWFWPGFLHEADVAYSGAPGCFIGWNTSKQYWFCRNSWAVFYCIPLLFILLILIAFFVSSCSSGVECYYLKLSIRSSFVISSVDWIIFFFRLYLHYPGSSEASDNSNFDMNPLKKGLFSQPNINCFKVHLKTLCTKFSNLCCFLIMYQIFLI